MWPPDALEFLRELEANNDREWFKANRERYDAQLVEPARALAEQLRHLGAPHFFRPYNDTRFHARPPIKEQLGVAIGYGESGGFYFELSLDGLLLGAGIHHPSPAQLDRFRRAMDDGRRAAAFERALAKSELELVAPELKRARTHRAHAPEEPDRLSPPRARTVAAHRRVRRARTNAARIRAALRHLAAGECSQRSNHSQVALKLGPRGRIL